MMPEMPPEFRGNVLSGSQYVKTAPRKWTEEELAWVIEAKENGFSNVEIARATGRSEVSVFVKLKRLSKKEDSYNVKHRELKYLANQAFFDSLQPSSVLDVYAGNSWWKETSANCTTNDVDPKFDTDYHEDAFSLLCKLWLEGKRFDVVDLDPYGSAYECFDFAIRIAKKGLVISFGEWGHKRWNRTDFVAPRYGIESREDFEVEAFVSEVQRLARLHKKSATPVDALKYGNFLRVYFLIDKRKEISQWEKVKPNAR
jgi:hypothetical protein